MDFWAEYADHIGEFITWITSPESQIPVLRLLQGIGGVLGALISALGLYKAWRYAESRLSERLMEFIEREEQTLAKSRQVLTVFRDKRSAIKPSQAPLFTDFELSKALKLVRRKRFGRVETLLTKSVEQAQERAILARDKAALHDNQRAMAYLLLGAMADKRGEHDAALSHFHAALQINPTDPEALEYTSVQQLKIGDATQALATSMMLVRVAEACGNRVLAAHAYRNCGLAHEKLPVPSFSNANNAYLAALSSFPPDHRPYEVAFVHELRGKANMQIQRRSTQAYNSLMSALGLYTQAGTNDLEAAEGVERVQAALKELAAIRNANQNALEADDTTPDMTDLTQLNLQPTSHGGAPPEGAH